MKRDVSPHSPIVDISNFLLGQNRRARFGRDMPSPDGQVVVACDYLGSDLRRKLEDEMPENEKRRRCDEVEQLDDTTMCTPVSKKTTFKAVGTFAGFTMFSSEQPKTPTLINFDNLQNLSSMADKLAQPTHKAVTATFTLKDLLAIKAQQKKQKGRIISQKSAMGVDKRIQEADASANEIAELIGIRGENCDFEWTHLIAYRFVGESGQTHKNLVLATKHCNTLMMFVEDAIVRLLKKDDNNKLKVTLTVHAVTRPETHIATKIYYRIQIPALNFDLSNSFDTNTTCKPGKQFDDLVTAMFNATLKSGKPQVLHSEQAIKTKSFIDTADLHEIKPAVRSLKYL